MNALGQIAACLRGQTTTACRERPNLYLRPGAERGQVYPILELRWDEVEE